MKYIKNSIFALSLRSDSVKRHSPHNFIKKGRVYKLLRNPH